MLDYAHNPDGVNEVCAVAGAMAVSGRRLLGCLNVGSRHPGHVDAVASALSATFDEIVLGCDPPLVRVCPDYAGEDPVAIMLARTAGVLRGQGVPAERVTTVREPVEAIREVLGRARPGDLVVLLAEPAEALPVINELHAGIR